MTGHHALPAGQLEDVFLQVLIGLVERLGGGMARECESLRDRIDRDHATCAEQQGRREACSRIFERRAA
jgi:hypothetical protein